MAARGKPSARYLIVKNMLPAPNVTDELLFLPDIQNITAKMNLLNGQPDLIY